MSIVKQILLQLHQGQSQKRIVRDVGVSKNTVRRYIQLAQGSGHTLEDCSKWRILYWRLRGFRNLYQELDDKIRLSGQS